MSGTCVITICVYYNIWNRRGSIRVCSKGGHSELNIAVARVNMRNVQYGMNTLPRYGRKSLVIWGTGAVIGKAMLHPLRHGSWGGEARMIGHIGNTLHGRMGFSPSHMDVDVLWINNSGTSV